MVAEPGDQSAGPSAGEQKRCSDKCFESDCLGIGGRKDVIAKLSEGRAIVSMPDRQEQRGFDVNSSIKEWPQQGHAERRPVIRGERVQAGVYEPGKEDADRQAKPLRRDDDGRNDGGESRKSKAVRNTTVKPVGLTGEQAGKEIEVRGHGGSDDRNGKAPTLAPARLTVEQTDPDSRSEMKQRGRHRNEMGQDCSVPSRGLEAHIE